MGSNPREPLACVCYLCAFLALTVQALTVQAMAVNQALVQAIGALAKLL